MFYHMFEDVAIGGKLHLRVIHVCRSSTMAQLKQTLEILKQSS